MVFGEIGLGGELRHVGHAQRRLTEAAHEWAEARPDDKEALLLIGARLAVVNEWAAGHHDPHFAEVPGADQQYQALLEQFRRETGELTVDIAWHPKAPPRTLRVLCSSILNGMAMVAST